MAHTDGPVSRCRCRDGEASTLPARRGLSPVHGRYGRWSGARRARRRDESDETLEGEGAEAGDERRGGQRRGARSLDGVRPGGRGHDDGCEPERTEERLDARGEQTASAGEHDELAEHGERGSRGRGHRRDEQVERDEVEAGTVGAGSDEDERDRESSAQHPPESFAAGPDGPPR